MGRFTMFQCVDLSYVYRGKKWFTFQVGAGTPVGPEPENLVNYNALPVNLVLSIGGYIPF